MGKSAGALSPAATVALIVAVVVLVVAGGFWYLNKPPKDPIAEAVHSERGASGGDANARAPMGGVAPKPGATDYAPAPMPGSPAGR